MENQCLGHVQLCAVRIARLEPNGVPDPGADNLYVTNALSLLRVSAVYQDGQEIRVPNACGEHLVNYRDQDELLRFDIEIGLVVPDPELMEMLAAGSKRIADGAAVGWASPAIGKIPDESISIEGWAKQINDGVLDSTFPYARYIAPRVKNLRVGEFRLENGAVLPGFSGQAYENENWFDGPLNDFGADSDRAWEFLPDTTIPAATCGYQTIAAS